MLNCNFFYLLKFAITQQLILLKMSLRVFHDLKYFNLCYMRNLTKSTPWSITVRKIFLNSPFFCRK